MFRRFGEYELLESLQAQQPLSSYYLATTGERSRLQEIRIFSHLLSQIGVNAQALNTRLENLRQLTHPNLVRIAYAGVREDLAFYVTDPKESTSLETYIQNRGGKLPPDLALDLLTPIGEALRYLHNLKLAHGAFSCDSIRIDVATERAYLGTIDVFHLLGLANPRGATSLRQMIRFQPMLPRGLELQRPRREGPQRAGPILTPETLQGWPTRQQTDVFLFGAILHRALSGKTPASLAQAGQENSQELLRFSPASRYAHLPPEVDTLLANALAYPPQNRPDNLGVLLQEFEPLRASIAEAERRRAPSSRAEAIRHDALERRKNHLEGQKDRRRQARRGEDRRAAQVAANPLNALGHRFLDMGSGQKMVFFLLLVLGAASVPFFDTPKAILLEGEYQSRRLAVANKQFDRERIRNNLVEQAEIAVGEKTSLETFERRLRTLRSFAKALSKPVRSKILPEKVFSDIQIQYKRDRDKGCALLDQHLQAAYQFYQSSRKKKQDP
jgi:serine/threonine protein kinase